MGNQLQIALLIKIKNLETGDTLTIMIDIATSQCYICAVIGIGGLSQLYHSKYTLKSDCK